jgi:hypothetical protein
VQGGCSRKGRGRIGQDFLEEGTFELSPQRCAGVIQKKSHGLRNIPGRRTLMEKNPGIEKLHEPQNLPVEPKELQFEGRPQRTEGTRPHRVLW